MKKSIIITVFMSLISFATSAQTPLEKCTDELEEVKSRIIEIDSEQIEIVDGHQDPNLMDSIEQCQPALSEVRGIFLKLSNVKKEV